MKASTDLLDLESEDNPGGFPALEILLLTISECFVYKIPPLRSASGHRAEEWDLANPIFTGCLRIYQADTKLRIVIYGFKDPQKQVVNDEHIVLFGECPIEVKPNESITAYVDGVVDSSRYYVVRIKDPKSTRTTNIGIGFRERDQAFDFKNALNEYLRYLDRSQLAEQLSKLSHPGDERSKDHLTGEDGYIEQEEFEDFIIHDPKQALPITIEHISPLKEGEKIKVKIPAKSHHHNHDDIDSEEAVNYHASDLLHLKKPTNTSSGGFGLKPPPPPGSTIATPATTTITADPMTVVNESNDEEWGDFATGGV